MYSLNIYITNKIYNNISNNYREFVLYILKSDCLVIYQ